MVPPPFCAPPILLRWRPTTVDAVCFNPGQGCGRRHRNPYYPPHRTDGDVWKGQVGARKLTIASEMLNQQNYTSPTVCLLFSEGLRLRDLPDIKIREISFLQKKQ